MCYDEVLHFWLQLAQSKRMVLIGEGIECGGWETSPVALGEIDN